MVVKTVPYQTVAANDARLPNLWTARSVGQTPHKSPSGKPANLEARSALRYRAGVPAPHLLKQRPSVAVGFFFRRQNYSCGHLVAGFHVQQTHALRVAAGFADGFGIHTNDFAVVADEHHLRGFVHQRNGYYFADAFGRLDVDYALPARLVRRYSSAAVRLPYPFSVTERMRAGSIKGDVK